MPQPLIAIRNVLKIFGEFKALDDINLEVQRSEVLCLIGPSGSGKSTLLRCVNFLEPYDEGEIEIEGEPIGYTRQNGVRSMMSERQLRRARRNVGMVFQQFNLWPHMTALQNVSEAPMRVRGLSRREAEERGRAVLDRVGLADKAASYPSRLSGGQQQRVAIARALAMEPHIMLFDEPTSALDPELVGEVLQVMQQLAADGMTMVVVTHEMGFAAHISDRVAFLDRGRLVDCTAPKALFHDSPHQRVRDFLETYRQRNIF